MVASNTLELPYYKGIGSQRGRGFGALAQVIGRTAIPFLRKYIVPAAGNIRERQRTADGGKIIPRRRKNYPAAE